ncbi:DUF397 domain-containing protein [Streptomyces sp. URMC 123]|uniref:DUF397 domain-containing protein n=1 Tax=Streptomyces sp. URMC 123 TaxID=3423403 RepID=UPI003F1CBF6B
MNSSNEPSGTEWVKSSYSNAGGGGCVEWAPGVATRGVVPIRDSKDPSGPALLFRPDAWSAFVTAVKAGHIGGDVRA